MSEDPGPVCTSHGGYPSAVCVVAGVSFLARQVFRR